MNLREYIQSEIKLQLDESVNWAEFYKMAKDTSGYNPSFEKKYGSLLDRPHVKDALKNTKDFKSFMKHINKFESVNEGIWPKSKLADRFEFILSNELKKNFKGFFHVDGYDLYHNDKKVMSINPDKDSVNSIVKTLKSKLKESVNEGFKSEYEGNDGIIWKKGKSRGGVTNFTPYYKGHNIDFGGHNFKTEKELKDFIKNYILSNQLYNKYRFESLNEAKKYKKGDKLKIKLKNGKEFDLTFHSYGRQKGMAFGKFDGDTKPFSLDTIKEEKLDEKLITFSNRAPYGQIVFMAGGAGSGKGFAIDNFIDAAGFKVRDVDEMKKALAKLDKLGKFSVDRWYKKYGNNLSDKPGKKGGLSPKAHIEEFVLGKGMSIADIADVNHKDKGLKNPNNVASLHYIVDAMGLKDKWLISMLSGKTNKETLPNLLFDITAKKVSSITDVIKPLIDAGYDSKNIHLIWVLTKYSIAVEQNKERDRVVPEDIQLNTHEGAAATVWSVLTKQLPKGLNGRIDVILNNMENTLYYRIPSLRGSRKVNGKDKEDTTKIGNSKSITGKAIKVGVVSGFKSLPIKKQGGGIIPEKDWKVRLYNWIKTNAPATLVYGKNMDISKPETKDK